MKPSKKENQLSAKWASLKDAFKKTNDKIWFYDQQVDLSPMQDGSALRTIKKKRPFAIVLTVFFIVLFLVLSILTINFPDLKLSWDGVGYIFQKMFTPGQYSLQTWDRWWRYLGETAIPAIWQTTEMCFIATVIGAVASIPVYYLSSRNVVKTPWVYQPVRVVNDLIRTVPMILFAVFFENVWGFSSLSGIAAMAVFTLGIMYQLMYEYIETLEMSPFEAITASGGGALQCVHLGLHPEIKPMFFTNFLYTFEINIRASVILGYVGAGGFGYLLKECLALESYDKVSALLVPLFVLVCFLQICTNIVSRKMR
jgi:phosphonate transport system permease protein